MGILLFTSGTTGIAKAVMLSHKNICIDLMIAPTILKVNPWDIFFSVLPLHHTYACTDDFLMPIYKGASIAYCEGLRYIVDNLSEARPTMFLGVPLIFESLYSKIWKNVRKQGKEGLLKKVIKVNRVTKKIGLDLGKIFFKQITSLFGGRMRIMICGGAAIDPAILQGIQDFGIMALQGYGLTECAPICALNPDTAPKNDAAGYVPTGLDAMIDDADPETGIGEIVVTGDNVMMGYYNNPEATADVLIDGWYHTGDLGYIDDDRYIHITGRKKNVIVTKNGKNIFPEELEYLLGRLNIVTESMVWGRPSERSDDTVIVANIKLDDEEVKEQLGKDYTTEDVNKLVWAEVDKINDEVASYKRIKKVVIRSQEFDKTTGKKIKRFVDENKQGREI
jgi:long-subunit acyl-CoA synthetase (AMP-forming)